MQKRKKFNVLLTLFAAIVLSMTPLSNIVVPTLRAQTSSAVSSQPSATPVTQGSPSPTPDADAGLRAACSDAIFELAAARKLIGSLTNQAERQAELQATSDQLTTGLKNLRTLDAEQKAELQKAVDAANRQVAALEAEVVVLKKQRMTFLRKVKYIAIGVAAGVIGGVVLTK